MSSSQEGYRGRTINNPNLSKNRGKGGGRCLFYFECIYTILGIYLFPQPINGPGCYKEIFFLSIYQYSFPEMENSNERNKRNFLFEIINLWYILSNCCMQPLLNLLCFGRFPPRLIINFDQLRLIESCRGINHSLDTCWNLERRMSLVHQ